jgi:hypothetical protein
MDHAERVVAMMHELLVWSERFEAGALTDPAVDSTTGERVAVRVPNAAAVGALPRKGSVDYVETYAEGDVVATDRRLLVVCDGTTAHTWTWADDVGEGGLLQDDGLGVLFLPSDAQHATGARHFLGVVPQGALGKRTPPAGLYFPLMAAWSRVLAAMRCSRGELDAWREEQREILQANSGAAG